MPAVLKGRCPQDHRCPRVRRCASHAMVQEGFSAPVIDHGKCTNCGLCARSCPHGVFVNG